MIIYLCGFLSTDVLAQDIPPDKLLFSSQILKQAVEYESRLTFGQVEITFEVEDPVTLTGDTELFSDEQDRVTSIKYYWQDNQYRCELYENDQIIRTIIHNGILTDIGNGTVFTQGFVDNIDFDNNTELEQAYITGIWPETLLTTHLFPLTMKGVMTFNSFYGIFDFSLVPEAPDDDENYNLNMFWKSESLADNSLYYQYQVLKEDPRLLTNSRLYLEGSLNSESAFENFVVIQETHRLPVTCRYSSEGNLAWTSQLIPAGCELNVPPDIDLFTIETQDKLVVDPPEPNYESRRMNGSILLSIITLCVFAIYISKKRKKWFIFHAFFCFLC